MMPFYALLLWLFYHRRRKYYYSHLILAVNEHAFLFIIFILILLGRMIWPGREIYPEIDLLLLYPVYIFVGMKRLYGNSYLVTLLKAFGILFTYAIFFLLAVVFVFFFWFRTEFL